MEPELSAGSAENGYLAKRKRIEFKMQNDKDMALNVKKIIAHFDELWYALLKQSPWAQAGGYEGGIKLWHIVKTAEKKSMIRL